MHIVNPYLPALVGVIGTLLGLVLSYFLTASRESRAFERQREILQDQLNHASVESLRAERRKAYIQFSSLMQTWNILAWKVRDCASTRSDDSLDVMAALEKEQAILFDSWRDSFAALQLLASPEVDEIAQQIFNYYLTEIEVARAGLEPFAEGKQDSPSLPTFLQLMREDVGVMAAGASVGSIAPPASGAPLK